MFAKKNCDNYNLRAISDQRKRMVTIECATNY